MPATPETPLAARIRAYNEAKRELWNQYPDAIDPDAYDEDDPKHPGYSVHVDLIEKRKS